jgi:hypothetical protein
MSALFRTLPAILMVTLVLLSTLPADVFAQRSRGGGSFGGSRSSGRSYSAPRSAPRGGGSFGGSRSTSPSTAPRSYSAPRARSTSPSAAPTSAQRNSFGGSRLNTSQDYTSRYGVPRKVETARIPTANGATNYQVHRYGGMSDGFMMGYLMGSVPWFYSMPFHPAFYYSRPYTVANPDGTVGVYPGTFQWGQLFFVLLLVAGGGYILYVWIRSKRKRRELGGADLSRSSFS